MSENTLLDLLVEKYGKIDMLKFCEINMEAARLTLEKLNKELPNYSVVEKDLATWKKYYTDLQTKNEGN